MKPFRQYILECSLREIRLKRRLTLADVAKATGLKVPTISQAEAGASIELRTAMLLAEFYKVRIEDVWSFLSDDLVQAGVRPARVPRSQPRSQR